ncbi:MAG TPA: DinB family protein [Candidatus Dormibacteraeota bacterium]|nr:DinB family protein [Candidatus Dormibacteraeota bacterium]
MPIRDMFLPEFDHEMETTRKTLERVPEGKPDWKPHDTSMPMGRLAGHIAELVGFGATTFEGDSFDFAPGGKSQRQPTVMTSRAQLLEVFDKNVASARAAISKASDEDLQKMWALKNNGNTMFAMPRIGILRSMILNHIIHHRGQLSVYLRMNKVPVPSIYGPSADEGRM